MPASVDRLCDHWRRKVLNGNRRDRISWLLACTVKENQQGRRSRRRWSNGNEGQKLLCPGSASIGDCYVDSRGTRRELHIDCWRGSGARKGAPQGRCYVPRGAYQPALQIIDRRDSSSQLLTGCLRSQAAQQHDHRNAAECGKLSGAPGGAVHKPADNIINDHSIMVEDRWTPTNLDEFWVFCLQYPRKHIQGPIGGAGLGQDAPRASILAARQVDQ